MDWYSTTIAEAASLHVMLGRVHREIAQAREAGTLPPAAQAYLVPQRRFVRVVVNEPARSALPSLAALALRPSPPPPPSDMTEPLVAP